MIPIAQIIKDHNKNCERKTAIFMSPQIFSFIK